MSDTAARLIDIDAYTPAQVALRVENAGVAKAKLPTIPTLILAALAGAFIAFGAMFYTLVVTGSQLGFGPTRLLGGMAFSLGLILVVVAGAELFTGNNLIVMAWADRRITLAQMLRNWGLVYFGNFAGAAGTAFLFALSGIFDANSSAVGTTAASIAASKLQLDPGEALVRGILCNALVCLAVWLCFAARSVTDKVLAILFPISAFVGLGFEHSVANMYVIPVAMMSGYLEADLIGLALNLSIVTLGNVLGGSVLVALIYWLIYRRDWTH
ncbi:formate/nitrite transporter family protein [Pelagibius sp. Alg239-R121]|uniref:formate/nitrite transporter family protein n=1 Tax=Pelagibius sp. Alg239-R121 TaxID=2993448 RepID=UPI0024A6F952|nr:formate/nitrite transporter family protein [Pelagibius sp. Alg239-R121]